MGPSHEKEKVGAKPTHLPVFPHGSVQDKAEQRIHRTTQRERPFLGFLLLAPFLPLPSSFLPFFPQFSNPTEINNRKKSESSPPSPRPKSLVPSSRDQNRFDRKISFNRLRFALPVRCQVRSASPSSLVIAPRISVLNPCSRGLAGVGGRVSRLIVSSRRRFWGCCTDWSSIARVGSTWEVQIPVSGCKWLARMELECFTISACFCLQY